MFDNIGGKLKSVARIITVSGIIVSIVAGILTLRYNGLGIVIALLGSLVSWASSIALYGFGQLVENSDRMVAMQKQLLQTSGVSASEPFAASKRASTPPKPVDNVLSQSISHENPPQKQRRCVYCGEILRSDVCEMCGQKDNSYKSR